METKEEEQRGKRNGTSPELAEAMEILERQPVKSFMEEHQKVGRALRQPHSIDMVELVDAIETNKVFLTDKPDPSKPFIRNMRPSILCHSGNHFDFTKPGANKILVSDIAHALAHVCRFAGHTNEFYSVAQHSVIVSRLVPEEFALEALMHDAAEAYLGDVTTPLKMMLPDYKKIEQSVEFAIRHEFDLPWTLSPCIKAADLVALVTEMRDLMPDKYLTKPDVAPINEKIHAMPPCMAKQSFLSRFNELIALRGRGPRSGVAS